MATVLKPTRTAIEPELGPAPSSLGRYRIEEKLGQGSCGVVYRAMDIIIGRHVALKVLPTPGANGERPAQHDDEKRFLREAKAAGQITHPNVVTVYEVGGVPEKGLLYIAMELVTGSTLFSMLKRKQEIPFDVIRSIGTQVAGALEAAHAMKVVHRDIKPSNLILTPSGTVKVVDFGIARVEGSSLTRAGAILGSPGYMSPEQIRGMTVDHRSDLFSLGSVLYELCTLKRAFPGTDIGELFKALTKCEPIPVRSLRADIPEDLEQVINRALAKEPGERYQSAHDMMEALCPSAAVEEASDRATASPMTASPTTPSPTPVGAITLSRVRRRVRWAWAGGAGTTALIALPLFLLLGVRGRGDDPPETVATVRAEPAPPVEATHAQAAKATTTLPVQVDRPEGVKGKKRVSAPAPAAVEPSALPAPALPLYSMAVVHDHRMGSCKGTLRVFDDRIEYEAQDRDRDSRRLTYSALSSVALDRNTIKLVEARLGGQPRKEERKSLDLRSEDASIGAAVAYMRSRLAR